MRMKLMKIELTDEQKKIIKSSSSCVVIASPGSGKTTTLAYKISSVLENVEDYQGVIGISYTNKASKELISKVEALNKTIKNSFLDTIHGFYLSEIIIPFSKTMFELYKVNFFISERKKIDDVDIKLEQAIELLKTGEIVLGFISELANYIFDISTDCKKYLKAKYTHIIIDEYQDCDYMQNNIFKKIVSLGIKGIAVGDPEQSIFRYSGSNSKFLFELSGMEDFDLFELTKNMRCHQSIINYAHKFLKPEDEIEPVSDLRVIGISASGDETNIAQKIEKFLPQLMKTFKIENLSDIAILTRNARTAETISNAMSYKNHYYITTDIEKSFNQNDLFLKELLYFVFGTNSVYPENIIEKFFDDKKNVEKRIITKKIKEIKESFYNSGTLPNDEIILLIKELFGEDSNIERAISTLGDNNQLNSLKPLEKDKISIMTIHKAKGSEFDLVFILDLYKYIIPSYNFDVNPAVYNDIIECKNIHYVSLTRAKKAVVLTYSTQRHNGKGEIKNSDFSEFIDPCIRPDLKLLRFKNGDF